MIDNSELYTFEEARAVLKTSKQKMRKLLDSKQIKAFKIGKYNWLIPKIAIAEYIHTQLISGIDNESVQDPHN